jgi:hypothetical protein
MVANGGAVILARCNNEALAYWSILLIHQNFMCLVFQNQTWQHRESSSGPAFFPEDQRMAVRGASKQAGFF